MPDLKTILLVGDNPKDVELTIAALRAFQLVASVGSEGAKVWIKDALLVHPEVLRTSGP
jgi:hypothetical protein